MDYEIRDILGSKMYLIKDDVGLSKQLIDHGIREPASTKVIQSIIKPDWICIDIGANLGYYALLEAKHCKFVHAIEPIKSSFNTLNKSIKANNYTNIKTYNLAVGSQGGVKNITTSHRNNWATMLDFKLAADKYKQKFNRFYKGVEKVNEVTLDGFVTSNQISRVDFLRMDVEGYETEIIKGGLVTLKSMPGGAILAMEIHGGLFRDRTPIIKMLNTIRHLGFKIVCGTRKDIKYKATWVQISQWGAAQAFFMKG